jgi:hypothetical protein
MTVKGNAAVKRRPAVEDEPDTVTRALVDARAALEEAVARFDVLARLEQRTSILQGVEEKPSATVAELAAESHLSEEALVAFLETVGEVLGSEHSLSVDAARRGALLAASGQAWENELGPLLGTRDVRRLLGVSRQRVDELLRSRRLIALPDDAGHRRYPMFQFHNGRPLTALIAAFWTVADGTLSPWSAAAWCTAPDEDGLDGLSPVAWASAGSDAERLARVARQDAARLAQ